MLTHGLWPWQRVAHRIGALVPRRCTNQFRAFSDDAEASESGEASTEDAAGEAAGGAAAGADAGEQAPPRHGLLPRLSARKLRSDLPPASWRSAPDWVDLELERAGLPPEAELPPDAQLASRWAEEEFEPEPNVLWPHAALDDHRSRAFVLPRGAEDTKKLEENRARLEALWRMSRSHGTSWDDLDAAFVAFAQTGKRRYAQWSRGKIKPDEKESGAEDKPPTGGFRGGFRGGAPVLDDRDLPTAALVKQHCEVRARKFIGQFCPQGQDPKFLFPSATRRLTARLYRQDGRRSSWRRGPPASCP
ncbi:unnamed protein product [Effrenium voratum]|nr:unnamed protein product [Effrenium voratum]